MNILMLLQTSFPPDIRVENEILSLVKQPGELHLLCKNAGRDTLTESWHEAVIHRLIKPNRPPLINALLQIPAFINILWFLRCFTLVKKHDIQIVHVHDLPLTPVAVLLKFLCKVSIIYDMHENYPAALSAWKKQGFEYWMKHPNTFKSIERWVLPSFDALIAVVDENRDRILHEYSYPEDRIFVVSNYVNLDTFVADVPFTDIDIPKGSKIFLYTGGLDSHRGIDVTLAAFSKVLKTEPSVYLLVVGGGKSAAGQLTEVALRKSLEQDPLLAGRVIITGWIDIRFVPWLIEQSDYCLIPQASNEHTDTTIPHKLFQYMSFGKPVIAADAKPMARILNQSQSGVTFKSHDVDDYARVILDIMNQDYAFLSKNGWESVRKNYSWDIAENELFKVYAAVNGINTLPMDQAI